MLQDATQDIITGGKIFEEEVQSTIEAATAAYDNDPLLQVRIRRFPVNCASSHVIATRAIQYCLTDEANEAVGDTASERFLSLTGGVNEQAAGVVDTLIDKSPTFAAAIKYAATQQDIQTQLGKAQPEIFRRRGKAVEDLPPADKIGGVAMLINTQFNTRGVLVHDMLRAWAQEGSLPDADALTARAWSHFNMYVRLSSLGGGDFSRAVMGNKLTRLRNRSIKELNHRDGITINAWHDAIDEYLDSGEVPEGIYRMADSLLVTDKDMLPELRIRGVCPVHTLNRPYITPGVSRPNRSELERFFGGRASSQLYPDDRFTTIGYQLTRAIEAASQTLFSDEEFRRAAVHVAKIVLETDHRAN